MIMAVPQIKYDRKLLGKLRSNYFNAKALTELPYVIIERKGD